MSNLQLPTMDYATLFALTEKKGTGWTKIAYATYARRDHCSNHVVLVRHHNTTIAELSPSALVLDNRGWVSATTTARLHELLLAFTADDCERKGVAMRTTGPKNMRRQDNWIVNYGGGNGPELSYMLTGQCIFRHCDYVHGSHAAADQADTADSVEVSA